MVLLIDAVRFGYETFLPYISGLKTSTEEVEQIRNKFKGYFLIYVSAIALSYVVSVLYQGELASDKFWTIIDIRLLLVFTVWWILMVPVGHIMGLFLKGYHEPKRYRGSGLESGGRLIGQLERTLVLVFYLGNSLSGIAFLVVAKSILRFSDLQAGHRSTDQRTISRPWVKKDDLKQGREHASSDNPGFAISEYIILGSLLSYTAAILGGVSIDLMLGQMGE